MSAPGIRINDAELRFGGATVFAGLDLAVEGGRWTAVLGASGVGKTSLLRLVAGLTDGATISGNVAADDGQPLADHRSREGRGQRVADLDKAAAFVGHQQHCAVQCRAAAPFVLVAGDLGRHAAGVIADEQQIAAQHVRQACGREGEADQEEDGFDCGALSRFGGGVKGWFPSPVRERDAETWQLAA